MVLINKYEKSLIKVLIHIFLLLLKLTNVNDTFFLRYLEVDILNCFLII